MLQGHIYGYIHKICTVYTLFTIDLWEIVIIVKVLMQTVKNGNFSFYRRVEYLCWRVRFGAQAAFWLSLLQPLEQKNKIK